MSVDTGHEFGCLTPQNGSFSPEEGSGVFELPADNIRPLIDFQGQVAVRLDPLREGGVHDSLTSGTEGNWLGHVGGTRFGHPGDLWEK